MDKIIKATRKAIRNWLGITEEWEILSTSVLNLSEEIEKLKKG